MKKLNHLFAWVMVCITLAVIFLFLCTVSAMFLFPLWASLWLAMNYADKYDDLDKQLKNDEYEHSNY